MLHWTSKLHFVLHWTLLQRTVFLLVLVVNEIELVLVEKLSFVPILCQLGRVIPNIRINLDVLFQTFMSHWTFLVILDTVAKNHVFY